MKKKKQSHLSGSDKLKSMCNFLPKIVSLVDICVDECTTPETFITLYMDFGNGICSRHFTEPLSSLGKTNWLDMDIHCRLSPEVNPATANRYIVDYIRSRLPQVTREKLYRISKPGTYIIEGQPVFCTGGSVIRSPGISDNIRIEPIPMSFNLDIDTNLTESESVAAIFELMSLIPNAGRVIVAHTLLYIMRAMYQEAWKSPCCCIFLVGDSGLQKTTIASLLTQIYNLAKGVETVPRLNASTAAAVALIKEKRDCVIVLDDLFPAESKQYRRKQEDTLFEIMRVVADGRLPDKMKGSQIMKVPPACGVLFTGEYLVGTGSNAARLLPVEMTPPDKGKLKRFQDNPLITPTFYYHFIKWLIAHYSDLCELLKEWLSAYHKVHLGVHDRLQEAHFFLNTAYAILMEYCHDKGFISEHEAQLMQSSFQNLLTHLAKEQQVRVWQGSTSSMEQIDFLSNIRKSYNDGTLWLADDPAHFQSKRGFDGLYHDGCMCLRGETLKRLFPDYSLTTISEALETQGALRCGSEKRVIQIHGTNGKRFYAIPMVKL